MNRLHLTFAATLGTFLLATAPARATETVVDMDAATELTAAERVERVPAPPGIAAFLEVGLNEVMLDGPDGTPAGIRGETPAFEAASPIASLEESATAVALGEVEPSAAAGLIEEDAAEIPPVEIPAVETPIVETPRAIETVEAVAETAIEPIESGATLQVPALQTPADFVAEFDAEFESGSLPFDVLEPLATIANSSLITQAPIELRFDDNAPPPSILNPHPNPLLYPTLPQDVEITGDRPVSLNQAIALALRNNIDLQSSMLQVDRQVQSILQAEAAWWPRLALSSNLSWSESAGSRISAERQRKLTGSVSDFTDLEVVSWNTEVRVDYDIYTSGNREASIRGARERLRLAELDVERLTEEIRLSVTEAYYDIQNRDQQVIIAESAVGNSRESLEDAQALERAGVGTQFDVLRSEVQLANDLQQLRQAESDLRVARRSIARLLDLPQDVEVDAGDPVNLAGIWELPLEDTIVLAFRSRAELEQQIVQREIAYQDWRVARAATLPQVSAFATVNLLENPNDDVGPGEGYSLGVRASWQFFDGGRTRAIARDQELVRDAAELEFANQRNLIRLQVEQSYYQLEASLQNVTTSENALALAEESLSLARLRFQAGVGTQTEVIDAQNDLTQAQGNRVTAIIGYNRALASLRRAVSNHPMVDEVDPLIP